MQHVEQLERSTDMIKIKSSGGFHKTNKFLQSISNKELQIAEIDAINQYINDLLRALAQATPKDSGKTADSWNYTLSTQNGKVRLNIHNDNVTDGVCIAILLQYGHATNGGGYVQGIDYINPVVQPIFDNIEHSFWKGVVT